MMNQGLPETRAESVDVKEYIAILLKRKWLILICFLMSMAGTTAFLFTRQPIYRANSKLLVTTAGAALPSSDVTREDERSFYGTQIDIMLSQTMLRRVQQRMKKTAEEIRENLRDLKVSPVRSSAILLISVDSPSADFAKDFANSLSDEYLRFRDEQRAQSSESALLMLTREINRLSQELKASNDRLMDYARDHNMAMLENAGETFRWQYWQVQTQMGAAAVDLANARARKELIESRGDAASAAAILAAVQAASIQQSSQPANQTVAPPSFNAQQATGATLPAGTGPNAATPPAGPFEIGSFGGSIPPVAAAVPGSEIKGVGPTAAPVDGAVAKPVTAEQQAQVQNSVWALTDFRAQQLLDLETRRRAAELQLEQMRQMGFKDQHPAVLEAQRQLAEIRDRVTQEVQFVKDKVDSELRLAQKRYDEIRGAFDQINARAMTDSAAILELKALKDDSERIQSLYNALLSQLMKIDVSQGFNIRNVSVLEPALVEPEPVYPKKVKGLLVAAFFGLGLGLALAFFIEYIDDSIKLAEEVERDLQLPFLGMIPAAQWSPDDLTAHRLDKLKQQGGVAEAYRVVRSAIMFSTPREKLRSILVTSAVPREGKTTTCTNLAIGFSQVEDRVLLVDGDLRRGEVNKYFGIEREKGLADVLLGEATAEEVIKHTEVPKLDVITSGAYPSNPAELLLGWRLKEFFEWAYKHYDRVVVDCTPVMGIADSAILGSAVDGVLFIIWAGRTSRRYVRVAKMTAVSRGAKIFGFVLNNLEPGRVGYYHYYPYYYSYYSRGYYYAHKEDEGKGGDIKGIEVPAQDKSKDEIDDVY